MEKKIGVNSRMVRTKSEDEKCKVKGQFVECWSNRTAGMNG